MNKFNSYPLLFPGVVKTATAVASKLSDEGIRLGETKKSILVALRSGWFDKIVLVDGSGIEVFSTSELEEMRGDGIDIEQLVFNQDRSKVVEFGKSHGECQLVEYAVANSRLINEGGGFYKLSPRYMMDNLDSVMRNMIGDNIFFSYNIWPVSKFSPFVKTIFYKTSLEFYNDYLRLAANHCSHDRSGYLESVFFKILASADRKSIRCPFPYFSGIAGTTGRKIHNSKYVLRNIFSKIGLLAGSYTIIRTK